MQQRNVFDPMPWQIPVWRDTSPRILLTGGAGGGKTHIAIEKIHALCMRYPGASYFFCRKTLQSLHASTLAFYENVVIKNMPWIKHHGTKRIYQYPNGSTIYYFGLDDKKSSEKIRGIGNDGSIDGGFIDEANALTEDDYNEITARLRGHKAPFLQIILNTNPDSPEHWIHKRLMLGKEATVYESKAWQNIYNPKEYLHTLDLLTGVQRSRLRDGLWVQAEGVVFPEWDPKQHIVSRDYIPHGWKRIRAIDFGYINSFVCLWGAYDPDHDIIYIYRELHRTRMLVEDAAKIINRYSEGEDIHITVADHDAEDRATLERYGIPTMPAFKSVTPGIEQLRTRIRAGKLLYLKDALIESDPELVKMRAPVSFAAEMTQYVYAMAKQGKMEKEEPVKLHDHAIDTARYLVAYLDGISAESYGSLRELRSLNKSGLVDQLSKNMFPQSRIKF